MFGESQCAGAPIVVSGKFLRAGTSKWYAKGLTYGPFAPNEQGEALPPPEQVRRDFALMRDLGANCLRLYFPPADWLLDCAQEFDLRVLIDVPWEKHRCFFEDWDAMQAARNEVRQVARHQGNHPAVFAISVVNEFPNDIVRFYGRHRLEQFVDDLLDIVHQEAPECLATFANFPTTEFLQPRNMDFHCFNVYLHDPDVLGVYLDRLQHLADGKPLLLGEYGIDSIREGEQHQAELLTDHVDAVFSHGLGGSFVFAFTDDWFTGGHQIEDWMFGVTRVDRSPKPAASAIQRAWKDVPARLLPENSPMVSVVVCSYNGARTLDGCLESLMRLNYPDYEVILVDDGSQDATPQIAQRFPRVQTIRQENLGLSTARNVGARAARGEIIVYTDDDCVADEDWLLYLVRGMLDQDAVALGGPNITPREDGWVAHCVAASPGNPSHVMLDDRRAEHVPGCNMAIRRDVLLDLGGFDPQYRAAGDDVDLCWRLLDEGYDIGFAPGALVWHHRRCTVRAYLKQQRGYGRSESMVQFKHPQRFNPGGNPVFHGVLYGDGAVGLPVLAPRIYHGQFGLAPFQTMYRQQAYGLSCWLTSLAWHGLAVFFLIMSLIVPWLWIVPLTMWTTTFLSVVRAGVEARLPADAPLWCRPLVMLLHLIQPVIRSGHRLWHRWTHKRVPTVDAADVPRTAQMRKVSLTTRDLYWENRWGIGREQLLSAIVDEAKAHFWPGDFDGGWVEWDVELIGDMWHKIHLRTATEELGWPRRFTRARYTTMLTATARSIIVMAMLWTLASLLSGSVWGTLAGLVIGTGVATGVVLSRRRCLQAATDLLHRAACRAGLSAPDDSLALELSVAAEGRPSETASSRLPAVALAASGGPNR